MYPSITNYNVTIGPHIIVCYVNDVTTGLLMNLIYLAIWTVMTIGSFMITKKTIGAGDLPVSMTLGSFTTFIFAVIMRIVSTDCPNIPLTSDIALAVIIGVLFFSVIFLLFSKD